MNIKLFSESYEHILVNKERGTYYSPNDISGMVSQIYILNFMLFKQKHIKLFNSRGVFFLQ